MGEYYSIYGPAVNWSFHAGSGTLRITGSGPMADAGPDRETPWQNWRHLIRRVIVGEGITRVGRAVFDSCTALEELRLPASLTALDGGALDGCESLERLEMPDGGPVYRSIGGALYAADGRILVRWPHGRRGTAEIPEGVIVLADGAFYDCRRLTDIRLPKGLLTIGRAAFSFCTALEGITLPKSVTSLGAGAFYGCGALARIELPQRLAAIGGGAFDGCMALRELSLPQGLVSLGDSAFFDCESLVTLRIPVGITAIEFGTFEQCASLIELCLPAGITRIGENALSGCRSLRTVRFDGSAKQWAGIEIEGKGNGCLSGAELIFKR